MSKEPEPRSREKRIADREELAAQGAGASTATQVAAEEYDRRRQAALLEELTDPDIFEGEHSALEEELRPDFGRPQALGQKEEEDVWRDRWLLRPHKGSSETRFRAALLALFGRFDPTRVHLKPCPKTDI